MRRSRRKRFRRRSQQQGFTLLEVMLALAILAGSVAIIGEAMRMGLRNSKFARDQCHAQFLCESKMAELVTQSVPLVAAVDVPFETEPEWVYSVTVEPVDTAGLTAVYVNVAPIDAPEGSRSEFTLVRWIRDPAVVLEEELYAEEAAASAASASSGTSGTSGSQSGVQSSGPMQ